MGFFKNLAQKGLKGLYKLGEIEAKGLEKIGVLKSKKSSEQQSASKQSKPVKPQRAQQVEKPIELPKPQTKALNEEDDNDFVLPPTTLQSVRNQFPPLNEMTNMEKNECIRALYNAGARQSTTMDWYSEIEDLEIHEDNTSSDVQSKMLDDVLTKLDQKYNFGV